MAVHQFEIRSVSVAKLSYPVGFDRLFGKALKQLDSRKDIARPGEWNRAVTQGHHVHQNQDRSQCSKQRRWQQSGKSGADKDETPRQQIDAEAWLALKLNDFVNRDAVY